MYKLLTFMLIISIYLNYDILKLMLLYIMNYLIANSIEIVVDCFFGVNIYLIRIKNKLRQYYINWFYPYQSISTENIIEKVLKANPGKNNNNKKKGSFQNRQKKDFQAQNKGSSKNKNYYKEKMQRNRDVYFKESFIKNPSFSKTRFPKKCKEKKQLKYLDVKNFEQFHKKLIHADVCMKIYSEWFCSCLHCRSGVTYLCDSTFCQFCSTPVYTYMEQ